MRDAFLLLSSFNSSELSEIISGIFDVFFALWFVELAEFSTDSGA